MKSKGYTQERMCSTLDVEKWDTPKGADWGGLGWLAAFTHPKYGSCVEKWLSKAAHQA